MDLSLIVATRNRAGSLSSLFDALARQQLPPGVEWEFVIVDNGSTDSTKLCISDEQQCGRLPLAPQVEPQPGKSRALNLAMRHARGRLWLFTDDDVLPDPLWIASYLEAARQHPARNGFAGRVLPKWMGPLPPWLHTDGEFAVPRGITNTRDFGLEPHLLPPEVIPGGVNTALRADAAQLIGHFRVDLGPGTTNPYAEDTEFMRRFVAHHGPFWYVPQALLFHCNIPERMTKEYILRWAYEAARCQVLGLGGVDDAPRTAGVPNYLWRQAAQRSLATLIEVRPLHRLKLGLGLRTTLGQIRGYRDLRRGDTSR